MLKTPRFLNRTIGFGPLLLLLAIQAERAAVAQDASYSFTLLATLEQPAPGSGYHIKDFEPGALNNHGDVIYGTDLGTSTDLVPILAKASSCGGARDKHRS
jgi:hypothetical protein